MNVKPLQNRVLVCRDEEETVSAGGIYIPDNATEKPLQGTVVAVGPGKQLENGVVIPMEVSVGDTVLFGMHAGSDVKVDGEELLVMSEDDILCILEQ